MPYGTDVSVFVEDNAGDLGAPTVAGPWWLSPDVDIPAHPGEATPGANQVRIRVHVQEEPILEEKIVAEVYAGDPSLVMSPTAGTRRIDPGNLRFRPAGVAGSEPVADLAGGTLTFDWTPSSVATDPDGPGHKCLVVRAFPESVTPPTTSFDVPNEQHEAQHNIDILETTTKSGSKGSGTKGDPLDPDELTGLWKEKILTRAIGKRGPRIVVWAFDPNPDEQLERLVRKYVGRRKFLGFSAEPPREFAIEPGRTGKQISVGTLLNKRRFVRRALIGKGLFAKKRLLGAATVELGPRRTTELAVAFDHSNLRSRTAVVLHGAQWDATGRPEGGITIVALAPTG
ncbi:MAG TPA: hypothetical protein VF712_17950 [Thermoleophilaceae bacterium]|jgi:hypothetical protein